MRLRSIVGATAALLIIGCGGGSGGRGDSGGIGEVTGLVLDTDGRPVADARVYVSSGRERETVTNSAGRYVLTGVSDQDLIVRAEFKVDDLEFYGQNLGRVYDGESTQNVNIKLYDVDDLVNLTGQVRDSAGNVIRNARVYAQAVDSNDNPVESSSASALTNGSGIYTIGRLASDVRYRVVASARTYGDDSAFITIPNSPSTGERTQDLVLKNYSEAAPVTPTNLNAVAYTTPAVETTSRSIDSAAKRAAAYEGLKRILDPKRKTRKAVTRDTPDGDPISVDLTWSYPTNPSPRPNGFIIYVNETPGTNNGYFLQDPLALLFSDSVVDYQVGTTYTYSMKAVSTGFDANSNVGRSPLSSTVSVEPLDSLFASSTGRQLSWNNVAEADQYKVYVFNRYPDIYAIDAQVYTNESSPATGTTFTVPSGSTPSGTTYYYIVVGERANGTARTFSEVGSFTP